MSFRSPGLTGSAVDKNFFLFMRFQAKRFAADKIRIFPSQKRMFKEPFSAVHELGKNRTSFISRYSFPSNEYSVKDKIFSFPLSASIPVDRTISMISSRGDVLRAPLSLLQKADGS
ncbi:MAG: hypothetical protein ACLRSW_13135 [Christensenellaceae bacterium]